MKKRVAIIGAGISGLILGHKLSSISNVVIYEKSRGVGGRMSTRYVEPFNFDHGAQFFTIRDAAFQDFLNPFIASGVIVEWQGQVIQLELNNTEIQKFWSEPHFVAVPSMNSLCKILAQDLDLRLSVEVAPLVDRKSSTWILHDRFGNPLGEYDIVISTAPLAQTLKILQEVLTEESPLYRGSMKGCYALMLGFDKPWDKNWIAAEVSGQPIRWISINSTKPGRNNAVTSVVAHTCNDWAEQHMQDSVADVEHIMLENFEALTRVSTVTANYISTHRWKYAIVHESNNNGFYCDLKRGIASTGDWGSSSRIENVWSSANQLAEMIRQSI